ncbi:MAG TPA: tagaturonate epimerase family protein, partial [Anaerolineaceae bacterium]|nr:tagaturonate epimerase family protein [Anaerolineaceae bacterium]
MTSTYYLPRFTSIPLLPQSLAAWEGVEYGMTRSAGGRQLVILANVSEKQILEFEGSRQEINGKVLVTAPLSADNAAVLRSRLTWLQPGLTGLKTSAGMGDRLGLATPGHVRAVRACGGRVFPIFAQQSIREMARTGRTPRQVMDDAVWGIFQESWRDGFGADADHLKTTQDIDACLAAGFTFFTIDPGEFVDDRAETGSLVELKHLVQDLPANMQLSENGLLGKEVALEQFFLRFTED